MDDGKLDALGQTIVSALAGAASAHAVAFNQLTVTVDATRIVDVVKFLRDDPVAAASSASSTSRRWIIPAARSASTWSITSCRRR